MCTFAQQGNWQQCLRIQISIECQKSEIESSGHIKQEVILCQFLMLSIMPRMSREDRESHGHTGGRHVMCQCCETIQCQPVYCVMPTGKISTNWQDSGPSKIWSSSCDNISTRPIHQTDPSEKSFRPPTQNATATLGTHNVHISPRTVRNRLRAAGLKARRPSRGPPLSPARCRARQNWCRHSE